MMHFRPGQDVRPIGPLGSIDAPRPAAPLLRTLERDARSSFAEHLLRLDETARRMRFGTPVNERFIRNYASSSAGERATRIGLFFDGTLRGVCELHPDPADPSHAEAAFSLEAPYRGLGHGARLFGALLAAARRQGVRRLTLHCLRENAAMRAIARRLADELVFDGSDLTATLRLPASPKDAIDAPVLFHRPAWAAIPAVPAPNAQSNASASYA